MKNKTSKSAWQRARGRQKQSPFFLLLALCSLPFASSLMAGGGTETADFLRVTPDPQSSAMGNSGVANAENGFAMGHNPALLGQADSRVRLAGMQTQWLGGVTAATYALAVVFPARGENVWGAGLLVNEWRSSAFDATDREGRLTGQAQYKAQNLGAMLSRTVRHDLSLGLGVKKITQSFTEGTSAGASLENGASALAWDIGGSWQTPWPNLVVAAAVQNLGRATMFVNARENMPQTAVLGAQGACFDGSLSASVEGVRDGNGQTDLRGGAAFSPVPLIALRAGYDTRLVRPSFVGTTLGLGLKFRGMSMDYAFAPFGPLGDTQKVSLAWRFGPRETRAAAGRGANY